MELTINKLIANDIINYGIENTSSFNYTISLNQYLKEFDEESQKYILNNIDEICKDISINENVADFSVEYEKDNDKDLYITYYWGNLLDDFEKIILQKSQDIGMELDFEDIKEVANELVNDDLFNDDLYSKIKKCFNGKEREIE